MRFILFYLALLITGSFSYSQRSTDKTVDAKNLKFVEINAENCYRVSVSTRPSEIVRIKAFSSGEYQNDIVIIAREDNGILTVVPELMSMHDTYDDKMSAHKVISVVLYVELPEGMEVNLLGKQTDLEVQGVYSRFKAQLYEGDMKFSGFKGDLVASNFSGDIKLFINSGNVEATTNFGKLINNLPLPGKYNYVIKSVKGNIYIN